MNKLNNHLSQGHGEHGEIISLYSFWQVLQEFNPSGFYS